MAIAIKTIDLANIVEPVSINERLTFPAPTAAGEPAHIRFATNGLEPAPWLIHTYSVFAQDHVHTIRHSYNTYFDEVAERWTRVMEGSHAAIVGFESRFVPSGDPTVLRGLFEFNCDIDVNTTGQVVLSKRPWYIYYDMDSTSTSIQFGDPADTDSDYWSMGGFANNYNFVFAGGDATPDAKIVIGESLASANDKTQVGRLVLTNALDPLPFANDKAAFVRMAGTDTASLSLEPGLKTDLTVGNIYLGGFRNTTVYSGLAFAIGNLATDNSAQTGHLRLPHEGTLKMRNQADDDDVQAIAIKGVVGNDDIELGASTYVSGVDDPEIGIVAAGLTDDPKLRLTRSGPSTTLALELWLDNSAGQIYFDNLSNADAGNIYFRTKVAGTALNPLTILGSMEVGLNKTAPTAQLHVVSRTTTLPAAILDAAASASVDILRLSKNDSVLSVFDEDGYLGILNTNPSQPLDITGNALITGLTQLTASANNTVALQVDSAASPAQILAKFRNNGTEAINFDVRDANRQIRLLSVDNGTGVGPYIEVQRNSNASTPGAGHILLENNAGSARYIWPDASGNLRIDTSGPTNANDLGGVVVGTQTSALAEKVLYAGQPTPGESLRYLLSAKDALRQFAYKSGAFGGEQFFGLVTDFAPRYGMDNGKSLNEVTLFGDIVNAFSAIVARLERLEQRGQ